MKTVAQMLSHGINTVQDLKTSLQMAAQLEFATIPPYLCAEWSIKPGADPDGVSGLIHGIVLQEMLHMGLALNMLVSLGATPKIADSGFIPLYPTDGLPGNVHPHLRVELLPLGPPALETFLQIEFPEKGPIALLATEMFPTIGDFYDAIAEAFQRLQPTVGGGKQVVTPVDADSLFAVNSVADALKAIEEIKEQGEGTTMSPYEPAFDPGNLAHYYTFKEIATGHKLQKGADGIWRFDGPAVHMPDVFSFAPSADPSMSDGFNRTLSDLLRLLQIAWTTDPMKIGDAFGQMFALKNSGVTLIKNGITPDFRWTDKTALH